MRAQDVSADFLKERARLGHDRHDELWDGLLHMVAPPNYLHQTIGSAVVVFLKPRLAARGLEVLYKIGVFRPGSDGKDYRQPDLVFFSAKQTGLISERGLEGAPTAVLEIRSPDDETYEKFDFWAKLGVPEIIVVNPKERTVEVYRLAGTRYSTTAADEHGRTHAASIDVRFSTVAGDEPRLRVEHAGAALDI